MVARRGPRRGPYRRSPAFRHWGLIHVLGVVLAAVAERWLLAAALATLYVLYTGMWRRVNCRVETRKRAPCRNTVRGALTCCEHHTGRKRSPPVLYRATRWSIPEFMWLRPELAGEVAGGFDTPQPVPAANRASAQRDRGDDPIMKWLAIASLLVAVGSLIRDLVAG